MPNALNSLLGNGLLTPLRRMAGVDFASGSGEVLVRSAIKQILGTNPGDLRWRPSKGGGLGRFRNKNMSELLEHEAEAQIVSVLGTYEPRVRVLEIRVQRIDTQFHVQLFWGLVVPGNQQTKVLMGPFSTEVVI